MFTLKNIGVKCKKQYKVIVTVFSSGCLLIGFGVPIIDYICNFLI